MHENRFLLCEALERKLGGEIFVSQGCACPEPLDLQEWTMITPAAWVLARRNLVSGMHIMTYYSPKMEYPLCPQKDTLEKLYILFSSDSRHRVYLGHVFSQYKLHKVVKAFARRLGFELTSQTKFTLPFSRNSDREY